MECFSSLSRNCGVDRVLKALGFDSKHDYTDRIPDSLSPDYFDLHNTFHHGFPSNPTCLAYDPLQKLLAIGTESGEVLLLGKPGLERYFSHPQEVSILQMIFITNKGLLVTNCDNKTLYLWSMQTKSPHILHKMEFRIERPIAISWTHGSQWLYVGTATSNVYVVRVEEFTLSGYWIRWKHATAIDIPGKPGNVMAVQEHPKDHGKVLIAYSCGLCVLWNLEKKCADKRFQYIPGENHTLTHMCWLGNGKVFACSYSDGSILLWNPDKSSKPLENFFLHESDPSANRRIHKLQLVRTESDPWFICSGGFPEEPLSATCTLTICHVNKSSSILSTNSPILDFLCLPSSPLPDDHQKPFALVVLTNNELTVHDLQSPGYPTFKLPYALDVHLPPVTCVHYCGNCPEELIASLHTINSKRMAKRETNPWPLMGGKWGEESPQISTDLIITGHTDGSVRLWFCNSVIFQPLFTMSTSQYFTLRYMASALTSLEPHATADNMFLRRSPPKVQVVPLIRKLSALSGRWRMAVNQVISSQGRTPSDVASTSVTTAEFTSIKEFAIQEIHLSQHSLWMCVANAGGHVLVFHLKMGEAATTPKSLDICFGHDSVLKTTPTFTKPSGTWILQERLPDSLAGFHLIRHCQCYYPSPGGSEPATVSSVQYCRDVGMLAIGTNRGFALVDSATNRCLYILSNIASILCTAAPSKYNHLKIKFDGTSPKPIIRRHPTLRSMSSHSFGRDSAFQEKVEEYECSVTALDVVKLKLDKQAPPTVTLWVGLASGHVAVYGINIKPTGSIRPGQSQRITLTPTGVVAEHKSPIVSFHFLNEWGDLQAVPFKPHALSREVQYVIVTDENRIESFSFPGFVSVSKCTPTTQRDVILSSAYFTCEDLPCLLSLTSCQNILVQSLPGLNPLMELSFPLLRDSRVLSTFRVSGSGQAMYMLASKIQRMSVVRNDRLNLPACLPEMFMCPQPSVNAAPTETDRAREEMFGENSGRPRIGVLVNQWMPPRTFSQRPPLPVVATTQYVPSARRFTAPTRMMTEPQVDISHTTPRQRNSRTYSSVSSSTELAYQAESCSSENHTQSSPHENGFCGIHEQNKEALTRRSNTIKNVLTTVNKLTESSLQFSSSMNQQ